MIGIYKITNPKNECYIGSSLNILSRIKSHKCMNKINYKVKNSYEKYGVENHTFEILEECEKSQLSIRENYYQLKYNCIDKGLNIVLIKPNGRTDLERKERKIEGCDLGVSLQKAAELIGISRPTLYKLIDKKQIQTVIFGFTRRVQQKEIDKYLQQFKN